MPKKRGFAQVFGGDQQQQQPQQQAPAPPSLQPTVQPIEPALPPPPAPVEPAVAAAPVPIEPAQVQPPQQPQLEQTTIPVQSTPTTKPQQEPDIDVSNKSIAAIAVGSTLGFFLFCFLLWLAIVRTKNYIQNRKYKNLDGDESVELNGRSYERSHESQSRVYLPGEYGKQVESQKGERAALASQNNSYGTVAGIGGGASLLAAGKRVTVKNVSLLREQAKNAKSQSEEDSENLIEKKGSGETIRKIQWDDDDDDEVGNSFISPRMLADAKEPLGEEEIKAAVTLNRSAGGGSIGSNVG
ncbi:hypothetical protein BDR26DRAFT_865677, partial [Obelidium mucronatum]